LAIKLVENAVAAAHPDFPESFACVDFNIDLGSLESVEVESLSVGGWAHHRRVLV